MPKGEAEKFPELDKLIYATSPERDEANTTTADELARGGLTSPERTNGLYPPPKRECSYQRSVSFIDNNHATGQMFPLPSYFDKDGNLIEGKIPVPKLPGRSPKKKGREEAHCEGFAKGGSRRDR